MKRLTTFLVGFLLGCSLLAAANLASATSCDMPLMVQTSAAAPNVMIVLDSSGSMREVIYHEDYDPSVTWSGSFDDMESYYVSSEGDYTPDNWDSNFASSPTVHLVASEKGQSGRYMGNYLNWLFFHASDEQRTEQPQTTRIEVGKAALSAIMAQSPGLRYGLMRFNGENGGQLLAGMGTSVSDLQSEVDGVSAGGNTPSAETMVDALEYFQDPSGPIQFECQQNFIIFITDGYPTKDLDVPSYIGDQDGDGNEPGTCTSIQAPEPDSANCSDYLDDVAYYLANNDLRSDLPGDQTVNTYTIGFGLDANLLVDTAENGNGEYYYAWNLASLTAGIGAVVGDIVARVSAGTAVAVISTEQESAGDLFRSKFMPGQWRGFLESFELPYEDGESPQWEAGSLLANRAASDRWVFTSLSGTKVEFTNSNADLLYDTMGMVDEDAAKDMIDYIRGDDVDGMRDRGGWKLGDIIHSSPLLVAHPADFILEEDFQSYLAANLDRTPVVYVGANDGMLHAFDAATGTELWAYVPESVLGDLSDLADPDYCHTSFVDLTPSAYEVKLNGVWRTVLVGGLRSGGDAYFALDVTNPYAPTFLWETSVPELVMSSSKPTLVRRPGGTYLWTGSGPDQTGVARASILDIATGTVVAVSDPPLSSILASNLASDASAYDADWDGYHDYIYQGDMSGSMWRWNLADPIANSSAVELFSSSHPIQTRPTLALATNGDVLVYFGTGRYLESTDLDDTDQQRFYCVRDNMVTLDQTDADLVDQTSSINEVDDDEGWFVNLTQATGQRIVQPAKIVDGVVYATSFAPSSDACSTGGASWLHIFSYENGEAPEGGSISDRVESLGEGVASAPVVDLDSAEVLVQTSDARLNIADLATTPQRIVVQSWKQKFDDTSYEEGNQ